MNGTGRRSIIGGALAIAVAGVGALASTSGSASAQVIPTPVPGATATADAARHEAVLAAFAAKLGLPVESVRAAMQSARASVAPANGVNHAVAYGALEAAAKAIGITEEQLDAELPGKSLAQVAQAHNVDVAVVKAAMIANASARVDANVAAGKTTAEKAAARKAMFSDRFDRLLAHVHPAKGAGAAASRAKSGPAVTPTPAGAKS